MGQTGIEIICLCLWTVGVVVRGESGGYVNVAPGKTYSQSSKYYKQGPSSGAANGDTSGNFPDNCIHTDLTGDLIHWWEVDLGRTYPVNNISTWERTNWNSRLYPFTITVDNEICTTVTTFPDNSREKRVTCSAVMYGQRVRITRHANSREDVRDRLLNLCELEIWVPREVSQCPAGRYGTSCDLNCNEHCGKGPSKNFCYQSSGHCYDGCVAGWYGAQCSIACSPGCPNDQCDDQTGQCGPCTHPYTGDKCTDCSDGYYKRPDNTGCDECTWSCQSGTVCDNTTGHCPACPPGKQGHHCDEDCPDGYYGDGCTQTCGYCKVARECRPDTGHCTGQCAEGFTGPHCTEISTPDTKTVIIWVLASLLIISVCINIIFGIIQCFRVRRSRKLPRQGNAIDDADTITAATPLKTFITAERGQAAAGSPGAGQQDDGEHHPKVDDLSSSTRNVHSEPSSLHDVKVHVPDAEVAHPYDCLTGIYQNTEDVYVYE